MPSEQQPFDMEPMLEVPEPYRPPKRTPKNDRWSPYRGVRMSCDICVLNIHVGVVDTTLSHAKHQLIRAVDGRRWLLCTIHAQQIKNHERNL